MDHNSTAEHRLRVKNSRKAITTNVCWYEKLALLLGELEVGLCGGEGHLDLSAMLGCRVVVHSGARYCDFRTGGLQLVIFRRVGSRYMKSRWMLQAILAVFYSRDYWRVSLNFFFRPSLACKHSACNIHQLFTYLEPILRNISN